MTVSANHLVWRLQSISRTAGPPCPLGTQRECLAQQDFEPPAQSFGYLRRDHSGVGRADIATRRHQVRDRRQQAVGIVIVQSQAGVAVGAKQAAQLASRVTMIGVEPAVIFLFAGRTDAALSREQHVIRVVGNLACSFLYPLPEFGIDPVFLPPVFIDFILVGVAVAATAGSRSRSIVRGLRPFFLLEIAGRGNHRCFPPPVP
jgi:hypothetical protein